MNSPCPTTPHGRTVCAQLLIDTMAGLDCEITVTAVQPHVPGPFVTGHRCPHGVTYWIEPTGEQIAAWVADPDAASSDSH